MKRKHLKTLAILTGIAAITLFSCTKDFIERKLDGETVSLLAPANGAKLGITSVTFWWSEVEGATKYRLQVVKPNFSTIQSILLDSATTRTKYTVNLQPGNYQWRVQALNGASHTEYFTYAFSIDSTLNIGNESPLLLTPLNDAHSKSLVQTFNWGSVYQAEYYNMEIRTSKNGPLLTIIPNISATTTTYTFNTEGSYAWRVQAANATGSSKYSDYNTVTIDLTAPTPAVPVTPPHGKDTTGTFKLNWKRDTGVASDSLEVNNDSLFLPVNVAVKQLVTDTFYQFSSGVSGKKYYWRLRSKDNAGNWSPWGTTIGTNVFRFRMK